MGNHLSRTPMLTEAGREHRVTRLARNCGIWRQIQQSQSSSTCPDFKMPIVRCIIFSLSSRNVRPHAHQARSAQKYMPRAASDTDQRPRHYRKHRKIKVPLRSPSYPRASRGKSCVMTQYAQHDEVTRDEAVGSGIVPTVEYYCICMSASRGALAIPYN